MARRYHPFRTTVNVTAEGRERSLGRTVPRLPFATFFPPVFAFSQSGRGTEGAIHPVVHEGWIP
jgi:hypothetical protein